MLNIYSTAYLSITPSIFPASIQSHTPWVQILPIPLINEVSSGRLTPPQQGLFHPVSVRVKSQNECKVLGVVSDTKAGTQEGLAGSLLNSFLSP